MLYITVLGGRSVVEVLNTLVCYPGVMPSEQRWKGLLLPWLHWCCCGDVAYVCSDKALGRKVAFLEMVGLVEEVAVPCRMGPAH